MRNISHKTHPHDVFTETAGQFARRSGDRNIPAGKPQAGSRHSFPYCPLPDQETEAGRLAALAKLGLLDTDAEARFDRITAMARDLFDTPIALISLVDTNRQWFKARIGLDATGTDRAISFCGHTILQSRVMVIADARTDPRFALNPLVTDEPRIRFYAGAPLQTSDGFKIGTLYLIDTEPRHDFDENHCARLEFLARMVVSEAENRALRRVVGNENARRLEAGERLEQKSGELFEARASEAMAKTAKASFLAMMNHELRTPLNAVIGFASMMLQGVTGPLNDGQRMYLGDIEDAGKRLLALVNQFLQMARIDGQEIELSPEPTCMRSLIAETVSALYMETGEDRTRLCLEGVADCGTLDCDPAAIAQIIRNLFDNAVRFSPENGQITISAARSEAEFILCIRDEGPGIDPQERSKVFEAFYQVDNRLERRFEGAGLGLAIARALAGAHGGSIDFDDPPDGKGIIATLVLPVGLAVSAQA